MILYHGTSTKHLEKILKLGIQPRLVTGRRSHYAAQVKSKHDLVYLTDCYPVYYAYVAACNDDADLLLLKVEVSDDDLFPDEDFVAYQISQANKSSWEDAIASSNPRDFQPQWGDSLKFSGVVATSAIEPTKVREYRILRRKEDLALAMCTGADAAPNILNHQVAALGSYYKNCVDAIFALEGSRLHAAVQTLREDHDRKTLGEEYVAWKKSVLPAAIE